ncbi:MAG: pyridoxal phosphate-dependent aminotransferase [Bacteroidales bacterium]|nr:pyridoxal phosphate-dependent aminotransferase [Bacteroidales bacterium]
MSCLSKRISRLAVSQTLAMSAKSRELKAQGKDVINLSVGEPDFFTPDVVKEAAKKAIDNNVSFYAPVPGFPELREAITEKLKRDNNLEYSADQIVVSTGAKHSLANVMLSMIDEGDEVIIPAPYWVSYIEQVKLADGTPVVVQTSQENEFKITPQQLEQAITEKTKIFMLCSPSNPTGSIYSVEELAQLAEVLKKHPDVYIISDEIYEYINFVGEHASIASDADIKERVIIINGVSKGYAMTGWRIGYIAAPKEIAAACNKLQGQMTSGACSVAQMAAFEAIGNPNSTSKDMIDTFKRRRDMVYDLINDIPGWKVNLPKGAFYFLPDISWYFGKSVNGVTFNSAMDLCMYILENAGVAIVPGEAFGVPSTVRLSYAASDDSLKEAFRRIKEALKDAK